MSKLEELQPKAAVRGILPDMAVTVVSVQWFGSEAHRIRLAHLFDPLLAVHTSLVDPLPHQISAVYEVMLPRQLLRFLLADDPGAGKTIMGTPQVLARSVRMVS